jgi:pantoate--beta-alanine ligase
VTGPIETIAALRARLASDSSSVIGLVPTMGALHQGHLALMQIARRECALLVVTIFVNPLQFDRPDDLARYPRTLEADLAACREQGVDVVFAPAPAEMYPEPPECRVDVGRLADHLCGPFRPGHFQGVATVVLKLFEIVRPTRAYFGEKDAQQLAIIRRMAGDFNLPIEVVEVPTVREPDGLAMSSRNRHLSTAERASAATLYAALSEAKRRIAEGATDAAEIARASLARIPADRVRVEYLSIVNPQTMQPVERVGGPVRVAVAAWVGATRLIDNVLAARELAADSLLPEKVKIVP